MSLLSNGVLNLAPEAELIALLAEVGFSPVRLTEHFDPFSGTTKERTAGKYGVAGVNVYAVKPLSSAS